MDMKRRRSPSRPLASSPSPNPAGRRRRSDAGFTLVEVMVATLVFLIGSVSVAQLMAVTVQMHLVSQNSTEASRHVQQKFDELMKLDFATDASMQITANDTLGANVPDYFDTPVAGLVTRRWRVQAGPTATTRLVTVRVIDGVGSMAQRTVDLSTILRQW